jgi:hypothetical protein
VKRIAMFSPALILYLASPLASAQTNYGWTISSSPADPFATTGPAPVGIPFNLYLWQACGDEGWAAAELRIENQATDFFMFGFTPMNGVLAADAIFPDLLLAVGGCPVGPRLVGALLCFSPAGSSGQVCIGPSLAGNRYTADCDGNPELHPMQTSGFGLGVAPSCVDANLCIHGHSWGACCLPDGTCITADSYQHCLDLGGEHQGYPSACNPGACCFPDGTCVEVYDYPACGVCAAMGGVYQGIFTKCASADCKTIATDSPSWGRTKAAYR